MSTNDFRRPSYVLAVPDAEVTAAWWVDVLGFACAFQTEGWVFVKRGDCTLRLGSCPDALSPRDIGDHSYFGYVHVDDVDGLHDQLVAKDADILFAPIDRPWGVREMGVRTPDGHRFMLAEVQAPVS